MKNVQIGEVYEIRREGQLQDISGVIGFNDFIILLGNGQVFSRATGTEFSTAKLEKPNYLGARLARHISDQSNNQAPLTLVK